VASGLIWRHGRTSQDEEFEASRQYASRQQVRYDEEVLAHGSL
jgi:hypothetical protein